MLSSQIVNIPFNYVKEFVHNLLFYTNTLMNTFRPVSFTHKVNTRKTAGILTSGGLCPGLNTTIYELVKHLDKHKVSCIGYKNGYTGVYENDFVELNLSSIPRNKGGSIIGTSRCEFDKYRIIEQCEKENIDQLYIIGGNGSLTGGKEIYLENPSFTIAGLPKTIDNDIPNVSLSFGVYSAVQEYLKIYESAKYEAECFKTISIVKTMGRNSGYLTSLSSKASGLVDLVLLPENDVQKYDTICDISYILKKQDHCVIAACEDLFDFAREICTVSFYDRPLKEFVPGYIVRTVDPCGFDLSYCTDLAKGAVDGVMMGMSGFYVGKKEDCIQYISLDVI